MIIEIKTPSSGDWWFRMGGDGRDGRDGRAALDGRRLPAILGSRASLGGAAARARDEAWVEATRGRVGERVGAST